MYLTFVIDKQLKKKKFITLPRVMNTLLITRKMFFKLL